MAQETQLTNSTNGTTGMMATKALFSQESVRKKFEEMLGKRAPQFITSVLQIISSNEMLKNADPMSVYNAAAVAATLDLPLNNSLGFAYIVPYNSKDGVKAQFQVGYKAFIQLAQRSGQFKTINATDVREGEIKRFNRLTGEIEFEWMQSEAREKAKVVGYVSYFRLLNGFDKNLYMTVDELQAHGKSFSQTFKKGFGLWKDNFEAMAMKTVLKLLLSKYAPLSIEMQRAVITDQAVINDFETTDVTHIDNDQDEMKRLNEAEDYNNMIELFEMKRQSLTKDELNDAERIIKTKEKLSYKKLNKLLKSK